MRSLVAFACTVTLACVAIAPVATASAVPGVARQIEPAEAIALADAAGPDSSVAGTFVFMVARAGHDEYRTYLNSMQDYRDPGCLTVRFEPSALPGLRARFGNDLETAFRGKRIAVVGFAQKVKIVFDGRPRMVLGKLYRAGYLQTHVPVEDAAQVQVLDDTAAPTPAEARG
jgi:hypothetical protein